MRIQPKRKDLNLKQRHDKLKQDAIDRGDLPTTDQEVSNLKSLSSAMLGGETADDLLTAQSLNHALRLFAQTLPEDQALECAAIYPEWVPDKDYKVNEIVRYGLNQDGEPQIFRVMQAHRSQPDWLPNNVPAIFKKLGFTENGTPIWVQPLGAHDAYQIGDIVSYNGQNWICTVANNVWAPGVHGWQVHQGAAQAAARKGGGK